MLPFASLRSLAVLTSRPHGRSFALFAAKLVDADALKHLVHKARQPPKLGRPLKQALSDKAFNATERGRWNLWRDLWGKPYTRIYQDIPGFPEFSPDLLSSFQPAVPPCPIDCSKVSWMFGTAILQLPMPLCCPCKINVALCSVGICTMWQCVKTGTPGEHQNSW